MLPGQRSRFACNACKFSSKLTLLDKSTSENSFSSFSLGNTHIVASFVRSFNANISNQVNNRNCFDDYHKASYKYALYMYICMICYSYSYSIVILMN
ncbi:hypothetical protein D917_02573 [Trichinella nativa]|uniref:Uncharacterized protein n=1 Tax=Trichinella nativa TaxID=6335 RepID=A0A1Y3EDR4_9BILA|nr:hypothetical protein D917_02573 [Trichinella nativa]